LEIKVEILVSRGAELTFLTEKQTDEEDQGHLTPLYEATNEGHLEIAQFILEHLRKTYSKKVYQY
jgi:ankyrin repeat protein